MELPPWLLPADVSTEVLTAERCYITELLNSELSPQVSVALARVEPGVTTQLHALRGVAEAYIVIAGNGEVEIESVSCTVDKGDRVIIAADLPQRITNTGDTDLEFYCVCTPRFTPECYIDLESG